MNCVTCGESTIGHRWTCPSCFETVTLPRLLVGITGRAHHGKDAVARAMSLTFSRERGLSCFVTSISQDVLAEAYAKRLVRTNRRKDCGAPELKELIALGHERRAVDEDYWLLRTARRIIAQRKDVVLVTGIRFHNEVGWIRRGGGFMVRVIRHDRNQNLFIAPDRDPTDLMEVTSDELPVNFILQAGSGQLAWLEEQSRCLARHLVNNHHLCHFEQ